MAIASTVGWTRGTAMAAIDTALPNIRIGTVLDTENYRKRGI